MALWRVRTAEGERLARGPLDGGPVELLDGHARRAAGGGLARRAEATGPVPAGIGRARAGRRPGGVGGGRHLRGEPQRPQRGVQGRARLLRPRLRRRAAGAVLQGRAGPRARPGRADRRARGLRLGRARARAGAGHLRRRARSLGYTIGNDVSSRSIEGENPLYLPQAKVYRGSCALGPCIVPVGEAPPAEEMEISLTIARDGEAVFEGSTQVALLKRGLARARRLAVQGAGLPGRRGAADGDVGDPGDRVHAAGGDEVRIAITGLGELVNTVEVV